MEKEGSRVRGPLRGELRGQVSGVAVFSHWILDLVVHRPDLPLYDNTSKVGLGLRNRPAPAFLLEAALLLGSMVPSLRAQPHGKRSLVTFGVVMLAIHATIFFGPPPPSDSVAATMALASYAVFAGVIAWWERRHGTLRPGTA